MESSRREFATGWRRVRRLKQDRNVAGLTRQLESPVITPRGQTVRGVAAKALGEVGDPAAVPYLVPLLNDSQDGVRVNVVIALGAIGEQSATQALVKRLEDPDRLVQLATVQALGRLGAHEAVPKLIEHLGSHDPWLRLYSAEALVSIDAGYARATIEKAASRERSWNFGRKRRWRHVVGRSGRGGARQRSVDAP